ncbi:hypothetical protein VB776_19160 [Arcicella sp. DC2W]|uniref:Uncharacterized protein n=1 Tax=Arcicella gelida TaxID=2984195 RepID=A0ABU5S9B2_9BACT|nr:hypothetical protein [Arcicella sp. DC2W]MEA5405062.1 hypothetical protein [Arcicella sp. DC2W]
MNNQPQSLIAHIEFEEKVKKIGTVFENDKTLFFTVSYLILTAIGMVFSVAYFLAFGINVLDYSQISDFILIAFKDPFYLIFSCLTILFTIGIYYFNKWAMFKFPKLFTWQETKLGFKQSANYYFFGYLLVLLLYIPEAAYLYSMYKSKEVKTGKGQIVQVYYNSSSQIGKLPFPMLVGTTSNFIFLYHPETKTTEIVPFNNISKIVIVDSSHVSKAQTSTPKPR